MMEVWYRSEEESRNGREWVKGSGWRRMGGVRVGGDDDLDLGGTSGINFGTGFAIFSKIFALSPTRLYLQSFKDYWRKESLYCQSIIS